MEKLVLLCFSLGSPKTKYNYKWLEFYEIIMIINIPFHYNTYVSGMGFIWLDNIFEKSFRYYVTANFELFALICVFQTLKMFGFNHQNNCCF